MPESKPKTVANMLNQPTKESRILIDARMVSLREHGISRYVTSIAEALLSLMRSEGLTYTPIFILDSEMKPRDHAMWSNHETVTSSVKFLNPTEWLEIPRLIKRTRASAFHSPSFASFPVMPVPYLQTVHDLIHLHYGNRFQKIYYQLLLKSSVQNANQVATVSRAARAEISAWAGIDEEAIQLHYNSFEPLESSAEAKNAEREWLESNGLLPRSYYLAIANEKPHKNLNMLRKVIPTATDFPLIVAHEFLRSVDRDRKVPFSISALIRNARAVLSPSLIEGFGRVPVEAVLLGAPVLASDIPSHREIFERSNAAVVRLINPVDPDAWVRAIREFELEDSMPFSKSLADEISKRYSATALGRQIDSSYRRLLYLPSGASQDFEGGS
ncbi:MAG: glycosyltransferase family 1 protein [Proteobacteria bacterium]|nr:MAG: glycosyltransferase family 1 protein [Pseudomonadota bacterium]